MITQPSKRGIPAFVVEIEHKNNVPHIITIRPVCEPENPQSDLTIASELASVIRSLVQKEVHKFNGWPPTKVNYNTHVILNAVNIQNAGAHTMDDFVRLKDLRPQAIMKKK